MTHYYLGIDLHKVFAYWHVLSEAGETLWHGKVPSTEKHTRVKLKALGIPLDEVVAAIESVEHYGWYATILTECGVGEVKLANPHKLRLIAENPLKNDKKDAEIIARYLRSGTLPESYLRRWRMGSGPILPSSSPVLSTRNKMSIMGPDPV